jgi:hypothetical protein
MKALVYHGPGQSAWESAPASCDRSPDGRDRSDHIIDDLWYRLLLAQVSVGHRWIVAALVGRAAWLPC